MELHYAAIWEQVADTVPDHDAIVQGSRRMTHGRFEHDAGRFAAGLVDAGLEPGVRVAMYLQNCPEYLVAQFGAFKLDGIAINVNYRYLDDELRYLIENSESEAVVFHTSLGDRVDRVRDQLPQVRAWIEVDDGGQHLDGAVAFDDFLADGPLPRRALDPSALYMLYTGGTTGLPKGVMFEQRGFARGHLDTIQAGVPAAPAVASPDDVPALVNFFHDADRAPVSVPCCPVMHGTGMWVGVMPIHTMGGTVVFLESSSFDAAELLDVVERERVTRPVIVGDAFARPIVRALEAAEAAGRRHDLSSVDSIVSSGAMWSAEVKDAMTARFTDAVLIDALGSTEGGGFGRVDTSAGTKGSTATFALGPGTILVDEAGSPLPLEPGQHGLLASKTWARGYYGDEAKTKRSFVTVGDDWYVITGDWATLEDGGTITLHGRGSNCINSGGEKIFPEEVEEALKTHPAVDDCYVVGVDDERFGQRVSAVVGCAGEVPTDAELQDHLRPLLSGYKIPRTIVVVPSVQRAPNGKADYAWAREVVAG